jgi:outer membrane murein-binding lipoprotein Lpp
VALIIVPLLLGSCAELIEFRTDIAHLRSDLQTNTQALSRLSARMDELEQQQAAAESAARQTQQDLSQAIEVLLRKALISEDFQITQNLVRSSLKESNRLESELHSASAMGQRASSPGGDSPHGTKYLSLGMTQDEVRRMLGDPLNIEPVGPYVFWHYAPMNNQHYVIFDTRNGQVSGWRSP